MLTLTDYSPDRSRRAFLKIGGLALGGLTLPGLLQARAALSKSGRPVRDKSVIFLFMHGGPPQTETFDPKMTAPSGIRSVTGEVKTTLPGITFGATFPKLAQLAHTFTTVRSFTTGNGDHDLKPIVGPDTSGANIGSLYARLAGTNSPESGMPTNVALFPRSIDPETQPRTMNFGKFTSTGPLGNAYAPFIPGGNGNLQQDMTLAIPRQRLDDRRGLLGKIELLRRTVDQSEALAGLDPFQEQAFETILGGVSEAFDLSNEAPRTVQRYDTGPLVKPEQISKAWNNHRNYADNALTLGKLLLMARRLCERGCGFVTVTTNFVWDMHADQNNATISEGMDYVGVPFDHAVSALIEDIEQRGLSDKIMLVACGEMGRTPKVNARGGRDHWGGLAPLLVYGGGTPKGQVIGASSRDAAEPAADPVYNKNLIATIMHTLLDVGKIRATPGIPAEVAKVITGNPPIRQLI